MRRILLLLTMLLPLSLALPALAAPGIDSVLRTLLGTAPVTEDMSSPAFLAAVPFAQVQPFLDKIKSTVGPIETIDQRGPGDFLIRASTYDLPVQISLGPDGTITGLLFQQALSKTASVDDLLKRFSSLAPQSAYLLTKNGEAIASYNPDVALAVGSAFKLGILSVLDADIRAGKRNWSDVAELSDGSKSLPTGFLQN